MRDSLNVPILDVLYSAEPLHSDSAFLPLVQENCHVHCGYSPSVLLYCFCFSGKRRFKFGRRGSPCVALRPALELDIWGENLNGAIFPPNDQTCDPHILALYRAFFLDPVNYLRTVPTSEARIAYQISGDLASAASDASAPKISRN